ncbi:hypothetical protein NAI66_12630, partial [Francisella tularensis subsp. holarctica]|nr:hypothetical protein [Francisella tularensis subsp. holarctica]
TKSRYECHYYSLILKYLIKEKFSKLSIISIINNYNNTLVKLIIMIDYNAIQALKEVIDPHSFELAADKLFISQSAVS